MFPRFAGLDLAACKGTGLYCVAGCPDEQGIRATCWKVLNTLCAHIGPYLSMS